ALAKRFPEPLAFGDVNEAGDNLERLTVRTHHRNRIEQEPAFSAAGQDDPERDVQGLPASQHHRPDAVDALLLGTILVEGPPELVRGLTSHLVRGEADDLLARRVGLKDDTGGT